MEMVAEEKQAGVVEIVVGKLWAMISYKIVFVKKYLWNQINCCLIDHIEYEEIVENITSKRMIEYENLRVIHDH